MWVAGVKELPPEGATGGRKLGEPDVGAHRPTRSRLHIRLRCGLNVRVSDIRNND